MFSVRWVVRWVVVNMLKEVGLGWPYAERHAWRSFFFFFLPPAVTQRNPSYAERHATSSNTTTSPNIGSCFSLRITIFGNFYSLDIPRWNDQFCYWTIMRFINSFEFSNAAAMYWQRIAAIFGWFRRLIMCRLSYQNSHFAVPQHCAARRTFHGRIHGINLYSINVIKGFMQFQLGQ